MSPLESLSPFCAPRQPRDRNARICSSQRCHSSKTPADFQDAYTVTNMNDKLLQRRVTQINDIRFDEIPSSDASNRDHRFIIPALTSKRQYLTNHFSTRRLPVNPSRLSFAPKKRPEHPTKRLKPTHDEPYQPCYHEFMSLNQAKIATIAYDENHNLLTIKKRQSKSSDWIKELKSLTTSDCVITLLDAFQQKKNVHLVYELMNISLRHILATSRDQLEAHEIAAICREISTNPILHQVFLWYLRRYCVISSSFIGTFDYIMIDWTMGKYC